MRRIVPALILSIVFSWTNLARAQSTSQPATRPATLQLLIPADATATVNDQEVDQTRSITFDDIPPAQTRRVTVNVKFPGGAVEQRLVDLEQGQTIPLAVPTPQPDKAVVIPLQGIDPVLALALSPDGRYLAIGLDGSEIVIWDLHLGLPTRTLLGHHALVQSLAFNADGKYLLSGSGDDTAILWDFNTGKPVQTFKGHTDQVMSVAFSPDGQRVLTGSMDKTAIIWDTNTGQKILTITGHTDQVFGIAYSPDGKTIATASLDWTGALWDAETGKLLFTLKGHPDGVSCVAFSPDGKSVATGSFDNSAIIWDVATGKKLKQTGKHDIDVYGVTYSPDGRRLLTSARDEVVMMWDATTARPIRTFRGHNSDVGGAVVSNDGRLMFSCSRDGMVKLWDMATGMELASLITNASRESWAVIAPDGLFDASETGRYTMGFRFAKMTGGSLDQFFNERFHAGLLSELYHGDRPFSIKPLGHSPPPLVKIVSPKTRSSPTTLPISIDIEAHDQGGGLSELQLFNNGTPVAIKRDLPHADAGMSIHVKFDSFALIPGTNQIRVIGSNADHSWDSVPSEIELNYRPAQHVKPRMYILAIGDSQELVQVLRNRVNSAYDRIDVIPLSNDQATASNVEESLEDVAALTKPQDAMIVALGGLGYITHNQIHFRTPGVPSDQADIAIDSIITVMGKAAALQRGLIADLSSATERKEMPGSVLRGIIEPLSRSGRIHTVLKISPDHEGANSLVKALAEISPASVDMEDWFRAVAEHAGQ